MSTIGAGFSMSLDGFIEGPNKDMSQVFAWMFAGPAEVTASMGDRELELKMSAESAEHMEELPKAFGAIISGRGMFDAAGAWGGKHPMNVPVVVLTHNPPAEWSKPDSPFTFANSLEDAIAKAEKLADGKSIGVGGADVAQQLLKAGLLDEIGIDLVPVLLGEGTPFFKHLGIEPIQLEIISVKPAPNVTHLSYRVKK